MDEISLFREVAMQASLSKSTHEPNDEELGNMQRSEAINDVPNDPPRKRMRQKGPSKGT